MTGCSRGPPSSSHSPPRWPARAHRRTPFLRFSRSSRPPPRHATPGASPSGWRRRSAALAQLKRYLAAYESVAIDVYGVETRRDGSAAQVTCVVEFSGRARQAFGLEGLLPPSAVYRFELDVADEGAGFLVRSASWEPAEPAAE
jgi:hypothetical protein